MKLSPEQIAFIHRGLCEAGYTASADELVEHIRHVQEERDAEAKLVSHWVEKCSRLGAERDRLKAALEKSLRLERNEAYLLWSLMNDRIIQAQKDGIEPDHSSSVFRRKLCQKLRAAVASTDEPLKVEE